MMADQQVKMRPVVYEDSGWQRLLPLVYMRPVFQLVCGMDDLLSKVRRLYSKAPNQVGAEDAFHVWCRPGIAEIAADQKDLAVNQPAQAATLFLNGRGYWKTLPVVQPNEKPWVGTAGANASTACICCDSELALSLTPSVLLDEARTRAALVGLPRRDVSEHVALFEWPWQIVHASPGALVSDWASRLADDPTIPSGTADLRSGSANGKATQPGIFPGSYLLAPEAIHVGAGTRIKPCVVIDAENGPVWIGNNVTIQPHSYVQGPAYIGDGTLLQPGAIVREGSTIGPRCKVGGEVEASIIHGFSNKQHDGFLGHSYVGTWVNIAADCINSDLKNTYGTVRVPINGREIETGKMFVGMFVGDYSKSGINVSFPTGAVIGFCSSVFVSRSPKFVPSFAWLDGDSAKRFDDQRGLAMARTVMARRDRVMTPAEERVFLGVRQQALVMEHDSQRTIEMAGNGDSHHSRTGHAAGTVETQFAMPRGLTSSARRPGERPA